MKHLVYEAGKNSFPIAILIKEEHFESNMLYDYYVAPMVQQGIPRGDIIAIGIPGGKLKAAEIKEHLNTMLPDLQKAGIKYLFVADANYYKVLAKKTKTTNMHGEVFTAHYPGYEQFKVCLSINYMAIKHNPTVHDQLALSVRGFVTFINNGQSLFANSVIHKGYYPEDLESISQALLELQQHPVLTCDIETFGLRFNTSGIATISFAWNKHEGVAFDIAHSREYQGEIDNIYVLLRLFFDNYKGKLIFHNALFDVKHLIYQLYMNEKYDIDQMHIGLDVFENVDDSQLLTFLALNSTTNIKLDLKSNAYEFAGNYAKDDIKDVTKIPLPELLEYNLVGACCTWYVYDKYMPIVIEDEQLIPYNTIIQPSLKVLLKMMLVGLPIDPEKVLEAKGELETLMAQYLNTIKKSPFFAEVNFSLRLAAQAKKNSELKRKYKSLRDFSDITFNPGSDQQKQVLLYEIMGFTPMDFTDSGAPACGKKTLQKLLDVLIYEHKLTDEDFE